MISGGSGPTITGAAENPASYVTNSSPCGTTPANTAFQTWTINYSAPGKPNPSGVVYWATNPAATALYIYTGAFSGTQYASPFSQAISDWANALETRVSPGNYNDLIPAETSNYSEALVQTAFDDDTSDPFEKGTETRGAAPMLLQLDAEAIASA